MPSLLKKQLMVNLIFQKGDLVPLAVKVGDQVLLPEYGGTKVEIEEKEYHLFRESDLLAKIEQ